MTICDVARGTQSVRIAMKFISSPPDRRLSCLAIAAHRLDVLMTMTKCSFDNKIRFQDPGLWKNKRCAWAISNYIDGGYIDDEQHSRANQEMETELLARNSND